MAAPSPPDADSWRARLGVRPIDAAGAVALAAAVVVGTRQGDVEAGERAADGLSLAAAGIGALGLAAWRRHAPLAAVVAAACTLVHLARDYPGGPALLPGPLALVAVGATRDRSTSWVFAAGIAAAQLLGRALGHGLDGVAVAVVGGWVLAATLLGQAIAGARERRLDAVRQREQDRREALTNERLRIARDLHDSVAHAMATISVQAGVAEHLLSRRPEQVAPALAAIRTASSTVLDDLGAILSTLRDGETPRAPVGGIDQLGALAERARADGVSVTLDVETTAGSVPDSISQAAFRVVQEALTNVRRHAGPRASAHVRLSATDDRIDLAVEDDGNAAAPEGPPGRGLLGMRERVESSGGTFHAGPRPAGGFVVECVWERR